MSTVVCVLSLPRSRIRDVRACTYCAVPPADCSWRDEIAPDLAESHPDMVAMVAINGNFDNAHIVTLLAAMDEFLGNSLVTVQRQVRAVSHCNLEVYVYISYIYMCFTYSVLSLCVLSFKYTSYFVYV